MATLYEKGFLILVGSLLGIFCSCLLGIGFLVPYGWYIVLGLFVWAIFIDRAPFNGKGRIIKFFRYNWLWQFGRSYFSHQLRQEEALNPSDKYLFVSHPHGIIGLSTWLVFGGDALYFMRNNSNLDTSIATVGLNFLLPFWRDLLLALGFVDASFSSLLAVFAKNRSACLVVGGSQEALEGHPKTNRLVLNKRKGFIKLALQGGAKVVPVYSFGETDMYTQVANPPGSLLRRIQDIILGYLTISTPLLTSGPLPKPTPLLTVMGKPLVFPQISKPSPEEIEEYHAKYKEALQALFDKHKKDFYSDDELKTADLRIVA